MRVFRYNKCGTKEFKQDDAEYKRWFKGGEGVNEKESDVGS